jgi:hypothetical protein
MILEFAAKRQKPFAMAMLALLYLETVIPSYALGTPIRHEHVSESKTFTPHTTAVKKAVRHVADLGGPTQPEMEAFHSVNDDNMVDLFSGDFSYSIPVFDVEGYPLAIGYSSGVSMDQEASWVGLGWNLNPGTITRNMRGLPDDFDGTDTIQKVASVKPNETTGVMVKASGELFGSEQSKSSSTDTVSGAGGKFTVGIGVVRNNYKGWGLETSFNAGISAGAKGANRMTAGLSVTNSSQDGLTVSPSVGEAINDNYAKTNNNAPSLGPSISMSYNTRAGLKDLSLSTGMNWYSRHDGDKKWQNGTVGSVYNISYSFARPGFTPDMRMAYTGTYASYDAKLGLENYGFALSPGVTAYFVKQSIEPDDQHLALPAYGYLNYQAANGNQRALMDYNREKDITYRESPEVYNIGMPFYTFDIFSISGEGSGGMFRPYRGDVGYVFDHHMESKDKSMSLGGELSPGSTFHWGANISLNRSTSATGPWVTQNNMLPQVGFKSGAQNMEAVYLKSPGEKSLGDKAFYNTIGGDDVVAVEVTQPQKNTLLATNNLISYRNKRRFSTQALTPANAARTMRDKRTQAISYLTAQEASETGLSKYIENYTPNKFNVTNCSVQFQENPKKGLLAEIYRDTSFKTYGFPRYDSIVWCKNKDDLNAQRPQGMKSFNDNFAVRWTGRLKADITGTYTIFVNSDDGARLFLNDKPVINHWSTHPDQADSVTLVLVGGQMYDLRLEYYQAHENATIRLGWSYGGLAPQPIPANNLYRTRDSDTYAINDTLSIELRNNTFRRKNHISEVDVLNPDGRRYIYGLPVYNLKQREATFAVNANDSSLQTGLVKINAGDTTVNNKEGNDHYYSSELIPAYAHSFLLTGVLSPDYVDLTGDGISDDDPGTAVKFNYSKISGIKNPYLWRTPYTDSATYDPGLRTDNRDDKGSYVYGEKELWYLHSIESKNMIAIFKTSKRADMAGMKESGERVNDMQGLKLDEIDLYTKADFRRYNTAAKPVKTVHFEYSYELCKGLVDANTGKLTLKSIWFSYNGSKRKRNVYHFSYNKNNPAYGTGKYDRWGNYKDPKTNPNGINNGEYPYVIQDSTLAASNVAAWALDSIDLPSGGKMKIDYESDDYAYVQNKRAAQMFSIAGLSSARPTSDGDHNNELYGSGDRVFVSVNVPVPVTSNSDLYARYLKGIDTLFFRFSVTMPPDKYGNGTEYVSGYAAMQSGTYGYYNGGSTIWFAVKPVNDAGETDKSNSNSSPFAVAAMEYLRNNLPSKAYPGSEVGTDQSPQESVLVVFSQIDNVMNFLTGFDVTARARGWAKKLDLSKSYVRLDNPLLKKYGGGLRVKRVRIYDNWDKMANQRQSVYGQEYQYTTTENINGVDREISSGVATYEPTIGGEENPWHQPLQYAVQTAVLAPVTSAYTELPIGESLYPSPSIGYRQVRVRSLNAQHVRSANGFAETRFFTSYDFPTLTDMTPLADNKKFYKPVLGNLLKLDAKHFVAVSQGFKVELNDMNGKVKSQAYYPETDSVHPITYTENYYHVDDVNAVTKHLNNVVGVIDAKGNIDTAAILGEDIELMMDMREEHSLTNAVNQPINTDGFAVGSFFAIVPMLLNLPQREETMYHSAATTKVIQRHGILDSVVVIDKGSKVTTTNILYDAETGNAVLTSIQNEFNDPYYHFVWPAAWVYDGMAGAYKNIGLLLNNQYFKSGKIASGAVGQESAIFSAGDEMVSFGGPEVRMPVGGASEGCVAVGASFPILSKVYAVDRNASNGGAPDIALVNSDGSPFSSYNTNLKVIRSGRRNISAGVGEITMLNNPLVAVKSGANTVGYRLRFNDSSAVTDAAATEFGQFWKVKDQLKPGVVTNTTTQSYSEYAAGAACGPTYYTSREFDSAFARTDCSRGVTAEKFVYKIAAGSYSSTISQKAADDSAYAALIQYGPYYATEYIGCPAYYSSSPIDTFFTKNDCPPGYTGSSYHYTQLGGTDTSPISQFVADSLGRARAISSGQSTANATGSCTAPDNCNVYVFSVNDGENITGVRLVITQGTTTVYDYTVPNVKDYSPLCIGDIATATNYSLTVTTQAGRTVYAIINDVKYTIPANGSATVNNIPVNQINKIIKVGVSLEPF